MDDKKEDLIEGKNVEMRFQTIPFLGERISCRAFHSLGEWIDLEIKSISPGLTEKELTFIILSDDLRRT